MRPKRNLKRFSSDFLIEKVLQSSYKVGKKTEKYLEVVQRYVHALCRFYETVFWSYK